MRKNLFKNRGKSWQTAKKVGKKPQEKMLTNANNLEPKKSKNSFFFSLYKEHL